ncbi:sulfurtransferase TusA family protein [Fusibacter sp. JL216-2]|uniref:sulfurtransferase TusA family protein n=1 Tax=Fusibacter sp. JL216-2 TaxID=3071453 RepID=UPI003D3518A7
MIKLDCFGEFCPIPLLKIQKELKNIASGDSLLVVTDHSCVLESIEDYLERIPSSYDVDEVMNGVWEITITKF